MGQPDILGNGWAGDLPRNVHPDILVALADDALLGGRFGEAVALLEAAFAGYDRLAWPDPISRNAG